MSGVSDVFPLLLHFKVTHFPLQLILIQSHSIMKGGTMGPVLEIRREKVFLQPGMSTAEVMKTYGLSSDQAYKARM